MAILCLFLRHNRLLAEAVASYGVAMALRRRKAQAFLRGLKEMLYLCLWNAPRRSFYIGSQASAMRKILLILSFCGCLVACSDREEAARMESVMAETLGQDLRKERHLSSVAMEQAVAWADRHGSAAQRVEAHYLLGRVYADMNCVGDAMRQYRLATEAGDATDHFALLATDHIGHLYLMSGHRDEALAQFRQTLDLATPARDTTLMVYALRDMARCLQEPDDRVSAWKCYERADMLAQGANDTLRAVFYPEYISLAMKQGTPDEARRLLGRLRQHSDGPDNGATFLVMGRTYQQLGMADSARYCLQRAMEQSTPQTYAAAAMYLAEMNREAGRLDEAYENALECVAMVDSAKQRAAERNNNLVASLTRQMETERENSRLRLRLWCLAGLTAVGVVTAVVWLRRRSLELRRQASLYRQAQHLQRLREEQPAGDQVQMAFRTSDLYPLFSRLASGEGGQVSGEQWRSLQQFLDEHSDGFTMRLLGYNPSMKPQDLNLCCLLKLGFNNIQISNIFHRTPQATTNAKKRLYRKIFGKEGASTSLNDFVNSL